MWPISLGQAWTERCSLAVLANRMDVRQTLLAVIHGSIDTEMFMHITILGRNQSHQTLRDESIGGCYFVCFVLRGFHLISSVRLTTSGIKRNLQRTGWKQFSNPAYYAPGTVIVWETLSNTDIVHQRVGFSVGNGEAISTNIGGIPRRHDIGLDSNHCVRTSYVHPLLHSDMDL